jgi:hypothetical protein
MLFGIWGRCPQDRGGPPEGGRTEEGANGQVRAAFEQAEGHFLMMVDDGVFADLAEGEQECVGFP